MGFAEYQATPDAVLAEAFFAPRDDEGYVVPLWKRRRGQEDGGAPARFPSREELEIPEAAFGVRQGMSSSWILMFWQWGRGRGLATEKILELQGKA